MAARCRHSPSHQATGSGWDLKYVGCEGEIGYLRRFCHAYYAHQHPADIQSSSMSWPVGTARSPGYSRARRQFPLLVAQCGDHPVRIKLFLSGSNAHPQRKAGPHPASVWHCTAAGASVVDSLR